MELFGTAYRSSWPDEAPFGLVPLITFPPSPLFRVPSFGTWLLGMQTDSHFQSSSLGPWGELEYFPTFLDAPDSYFSQLLSKTKTHWFFSGKKEEEVLALFERLETPDPHSGVKWIKTNDGILLEPEFDFLESLTAEQANGISAEIVTKAKRGDPRLDYFTIECGDFRIMTEGLDLPEELITWVESRCFRVHQKTFFASSVHALMRISDEDLQLRFLKSLLRCRSLIVRLKIRQGQDLEAISRWWSAGPNRSRSLPLLEAALETRGVDTIDLLHLLPPVPRRLLNTYALERDRYQDMSPDCYWASMNFFEPAMSHRFLDEEFPRTYYFLDRFEVVEPPYEFGDVIMLVDREQDRFVHSYVYIAEDIIYTKNGTGKFFPYVLMKMSDMLTRYMETESYEAEVYRLCAQVSVS